MAGRPEGVFSTVAIRTGRTLESFRFLAGYLSVVGGISLLIAVCQWALESGDIVGEGARIVNPLLAGVLLAAIGIWHVWPQRVGHMPCASHRGIGGRTFSHGCQLGCSSIGCCLTMAGLQFVGGAMNIGLMVGLALWMLAEAVLPWKRQVAASTGIALLTAGGLTIASAIV